MEQFAQITFFELINIEDILECHFKFYMTVSPKIFQIIRTTVSMNYRNWTAHCKHFGSLLSWRIGCQEIARASLNLCVAGLLDHNKIFFLKNIELEIPARILELEYSS